MLSWLIFINSNPQSPKTMPIRASMTNIIAFVRDLVGETEPVPVEGEETCVSSLTDQSILDTLDETRLKVRYEPLHCDLSVLPGGRIACVEFFACEKYLDDAAQVLDGTYTPLDPTADFDEFSPFHGRFTRKTSGNAVLFLVGNRYDPYRAASDILIKMASTVKNDVDFKDSSTSLSASQASKQMLVLAAEYARKARVHTISFSRSDV